jgi:transcriptional regulator with XRE-family HTH domain
MKDILSSTSDLSTAFRQAREDLGLTAVELARRSGRARTLIHRLEAGGDVTVASLLDLLRAMNLGLRIEPLAPPTLDAVRARFGEDEEAAP